MILEKKPFIKLSGSNTFYTTKWEEEIIFIRPKKQNELGEEKLKSLVDQKFKKKEDKNYC